VHDQSHVSCYFHRARPAVIACQMCGRPLCRKCADTNFMNRPICRPCCAQRFLRQRRSAGVVVLALVAFLIGAAYLFVFLFLILEPHGHPLQTWLAPYEIATGMLSVMAVVCGIGLLRLKNWARVGMIVFAIAAIVFQCYLSVYLAVLVPSTGGVFYNFFGVVCGLTYILPWAVPYIVFLTQPLVKAQFGHTGGKIAAAEISPPPQN